MKGVNNYLKNITKSVAYAAVDIGKSDLMPNVVEFADSNREFVTATYSTLKNPAMAVKKSVDAIQKSKVYQALDYGAKNLFEDLRTGNFYNKEREDRDLARLAGMDMNWDDLSEFGIDDDWESKIGTSSSSRDDITAGDVKIVGAIEGSNAAVAKATVNAVITSSQHVAESNRAGIGILYTQNERLFSGLHSDISVLNTTMANLYNLSHATFQNMDKNMSDYFTQNLKLSTERNAILKEMLEMQRNQYKSAMDKENEAAMKRSGSGKKRWSDISSSGIPNFDSYIEAVKKNISSEISNMGIAGFSEDSNMLATFMTSPLKGVVKTMVSGLIPATVKAASKELDSTISGIFGNLIGALGNARSSGNDGIMGILAKFLGVNTSVNRSIDTSKYEKGPIPFDGITRKAIIDVIPTHLRRIEAALTGRPEEMFDYNAGRWVKMQSIKKEFDKIRENAIASGTADVRDVMGKRVNSIIRGGAYTKNDQDKIKQAEMEFYKFLYDHNGRFDPKASAEKNGVDYNYPTFKQYYSIIAKAYEEMERKQYKDSSGAYKVRDSYSIRMRAPGNILAAKDAEERQYRQMESSVSNVFHQYFGAPEADKHGRYSDKGMFNAFNSLNSTKDSYGNTLFDYLYNINKELTWQRLNGVPGVKVKGRNNYSSMAFEKIDISNPNKKSPIDYERRIREDEAVRSKALTAIAKGKAIDLRDFDEDEQAYLVKLSEMIRNENTEEYKKEIEGYADESVISRFMEKHFYKTNIKSIKDVQKAIEKADKEGKNTDEVRLEGKEEKFFKKLIGKFGPNGIVGGITAASAEALTNILYTADKAIYEMMYKSELKSEIDGNKYNGFMDMIAGKIEGTFDNVKKKIEENIIEPFKKRLGIGDDFKDRFKDSLTDIGAGFINTFIGANKEVYGPAFHEAQKLMGIREGETIAQKARKQKRDRLSGEIESALSNKNLLDDSFIKLLESHGLNFAEYSNIDEAKEVLMPILYKDFYSATNGLKEIGYDRKHMDYALSHITSDKKLIKKFADQYGFRIEGATDEEIAANFKKQMSKRNDVKNANLLLRNGAYDDIRAYADGNQFNGTIEQKQRKLMEMGAKAEDVMKLTTHEALDRKFVKLHKVMAKGTMGIPFMGKTMLSKGELLFNSRGMSMVNKTDAYNITEPTHILNSPDSHDLLTGLGVKGLGPKSTIQQDLGRENLAKERIFNNADGNIKINNQFDVKDIIAQAKQYLPEGLAGGVVGGVLSTVFGLVGGPILGAAVGASANIIKNSEFLKSKLFGKMGEDGERDDSGLVRKATVDAVRKTAPSMLKYGLAGVIPGLLTPLGPVGGLMVGGAIGFLKSNDAFREKMFGESGIIKFGNKEKNIIKKMLPGAGIGAGAGAIATLFGGPFGLLGNAAVGAALGMMASTDEFKEGILGQTINGVRVGGVVGAAKEAFEPLASAGREFKDKLLEVLDKNIVKPINDFLTPAIHAIPQVMSIIPRKINQMIEKRFGRSLDGMVKDIIVSPLKKVMDKFVTPVGTKVLGAVTSPFRLLGKAGDSIRKRQIKTRNADYMTADERVAWALEHGMEADGLDQVLSTVGKKDGMSLEQAKSIKDSLSSITDTVSNTTAAKKRQEKEVNSILDNYKTEDGKTLSSKAKKEVRKALLAGETDKVAGILQRYRLEGSDRGLSKEQLDSLLNGDLNLRASMEKYTDFARREQRARNLSEDDKEEALKKVQADFEKLGINVDLKDKHEIGKLIKYFDTEILRNEANPDEANKEAELDIENNALFKNIATGVADIADMLKYIATGDTEYLKAAKSREQEAVDKSIEKANEVFDNRSARAVDLMGEETYNELSPEAQDALIAGGQNILRRRHSTADNKDARTLSEGSVSAADMNALYERDKEGNRLSQSTSLDRIAQIKKLGYYMDSKTVRAINALSGVHYKQVLVFLKDKNIRRMVEGRALTENDINFAMSNFARKNTFSRRCRILYVAGKRSKDYNTFESINALSGAKLQAIKSGMEKAKPEETDSVDTIKLLPGPTEDGVTNNGIGTFLLSGAKAIGGALLGGAKSIGGSLLGSLFGGNKEGDSESTGKSSGALSTLLSTVGNKGSGFSISSGNSDETDKSNDGKDVHMTSEGPVLTERTSDGTVEYDTSDSQTKDVLNKLALKEKAQMKLQEAQLKACELIKNNFDTSGMKESKGGKLGWLALLLMGGLLAKSGVLQTLYNNVVKPVWTDHIKPWIDNTVVPWFDNKVVPFITDVAIPKIGDVMATAIGGIGEILIDVAPKVIAAAIKGLPKAFKTAVKIGGRTLDELLGNETNSGGKTTVDGTEISGESGMYDEKGNLLTGEDIAAGNFKKIYNAQGVEGTVNKDGSVTFKDQSFAGSTYAKKVGSGMIHSFAQGGNNIITKGAGKVFDFMTGKTTLKDGAKPLFSKIFKSGTQEAAEATAREAASETGEKITKEALEKMIKEAVESGAKKGGKRPLLMKLGGYAGKAITAPIEAAGKAGASFKDWLRKEFDLAVNNTVESTAREVTEETAENIAEKTVKKAVGEGAEAAAKNKSFLVKLLARAKDGIAKLFSDSTVIKKLKKVADSLGITKVTEWIDKFKGKLIGIFDDALKKGASKVGKEAMEKAIGKINIILTVALLVADFIAGCDQAESILGVKETTVVEEVVAGLINALCNLLVIPAIIPGTNWIARQIFDFFGKGLEERQAEADKAYEAYKKETGSTLSKEEYLKRESSVTGKIGGWFSDRWQDVKNLGKSASEGIKTAGKSIGKALSTGKDLITGKTSVKELFTSKSSESTKKAIEAASAGKISVFSKDYWATGKGADDELGFNSLFDGLTKIINAPTLVIKSAMNSFSDGINNIGSFFTKKFSGIKEFFTNPIEFITNKITGGQTTNTTATTTVQTTRSGGFFANAREGISNMVTNIKNFFTGGSGTSAPAYGMGYSKQIDPSIAGIRFNAGYDSEYQTIGDSGCGPAAAVNVLESMYGRGSSAVVDAAKYALNRGYKEANGGTKPGFFADYFSRAGYGSTTSYNRNQIERNINSGMPTVLMGHDSNGNSSSTPFGKTPHYVTVTGLDSKGRAIVQDPESRYDNQLYSVKDLMNKTTLGVSAFGKKRKTSSSRRTKFGRGLRFGRGKSQLILIGDSRTVGMKQAVGTDNNIWSAKVGAGYSWFNSTGISAIESQINSNTAVVILMGVNDILAPSTYSKYVSTINSKAKTWVGKGAEVYYVSVNPVDTNGYKTPYGTITNSAIETWNSNMKSKLSNDVKYIDTYSQILSSFKATDGIHYDSSTYKSIYNLVKSAVASGVSSSSAQTVSNIGNLSSGNNTDTIGGLLRGIINNSPLGKVFTSLTTFGSKNVSTNATADTGSISGNQTGTFPKYALNDSQIKGVANILSHEQPGLSGYMAEASLMANLVDKTGDDKATVENLVKKATGGWFAHGKDRFYNYGNPPADAIKAAKAVLVNGLRTLPRYVDEHDCFSDLTSVTTNGESHRSFKDRSKYVKHQTKIKNRYGASGTFYTFPNEGADPFYYTSESLRTKWGDFHYTTDGVAAKGGNKNKPRSKWGRGNEDGIWWYLTQKLGMTDEGAAGLMGNLQAESGMRPNNLENLCEQKTGYNDETYTAAVDSGKINKATFKNPLPGKQYGYGLAQWTSPGRKEGLYDLVKSKKVSIADLGTQLEWLGTELQKSYSGVYNVLKSTNSLATASNKVLHDFERPANASAQEGKRQSFGRTWYNKFKGTKGTEITGATTPNGVDTSSSGGNTATEANDTLGSFFQAVLNNSAVGKVFNSLLGTSYSEATSSGGANMSGGSSSASGDAAAVVQVAQKEIGTGEHPRVNENKYNDWYYGRNVWGDAYPWCAAFVSWVGNQAGVSKDIIPKDAYTVTAYQKLIKNGGKISNSEARAGDIIYFTKNGSPSGIYHTGIVETHENGKIGTIEGNTSNVVARRSYATNSSKVLVARPQYKNTSGNTVNFSGSNSTTTSDAPDYSNTRGSNGIKPLSKFGTFRDTLYGKGTDSTTIRHKTKDGYVTVEQSAYDKEAGRALKSLERKNVYVYQSGKGTSGQGTNIKDYSNLINAIINILMTIANNTDKLNTIITILNDKLGVEITSQDVSNATGKQDNLKTKLANAFGANGVLSLSKINGYADTVGDASINSIITAMNVIASE